MVEKEQTFQTEYVYPPNPYTARGYNSHISCSPTKNKIVYCSATVVILRDANDLSKCDVFNEHKFETSVARFSPSGAYVCSGDVRGNVIIWETEGNHCIKKQYENAISGEIKDIAWTGDNQRIAVVGKGKTNFGKVFLLDTGSSVGEISQVSKELNAVDIKPTRPFKLAAGGEETLVTFYEGPPFKYKKTNKTHTGFVNGLRFSPTGNFFVSVSHDKTIVLYDAVTGDELKVLDHAGNNHEGAINFCDWFEDGNFFATASNDKSVKIWHAEGNKCVKTLRPSKELSVDDFQVSVGIIKNRVFSVSLSGAINSWNYSPEMNDGELPNISAIGHQSNIKELVYNSLNHVLISGDGVGRILIWKNQVGYLPKGKQHGKNIVRLIESCDKKLIYSVSNDGILKVLDINEMAFVKEVELKKKMPVDLIADKNTPSICYVVFEDNEIDIFDNLELKKEIDVAFAPEAGDINHKGDILAIGDREGFVHLMNPANGEILAKLQNFSKITCVKFSTDDKLLAVGETSSKIKLWNVEKRESLSDKLVFHSASITSICFSASNKFMLTTSMDNGYYIWCTETHERVAEVKNLHKGGINCGVFDETGKVITGGNDNLIRVTKPVGVVIA